MINIIELKNIYSGWPGAILGGGPSMMDDFLKLTYGTILISVNHHALKIAWPSYMVFLDDPARYEHTLVAAKGYQGVKISPLADWTNVDLSGTEWWRGNFSSHLATWLACWMGCDPVMLCGMDCYQGRRSPDADPKDNAYNTPLEEHLAGWRQAFEKCPHPERIKAISGPLVEIFGNWQPFPSKRLLTKPER